MPAFVFPVQGLEDFVRLFDQDVDRYPYYSVILYTPQNGLDQRLHEYVVDHWTLLNRLTGKTSLLVALEERRGDRPKRSIDDFRPEEVYDIARELGVSVADVPALVFFTSPRDRQDTLVLKLADFLPSDVSDEELTDFFRGLAAVVDSCAESNEGERLECLGRHIETDWPDESRWRGRAAEISGAVVSSTTKAASVIQALSVIIQIIGRIA